MDFKFKPFLDEVEIFVQAGKGGNGLSLMRDVHKTRKLAPSGGNGHPGGSVILVGNERYD
jgi:GTP-binding protein